jgi:HEAT repeat protein
MIGGSALIAAKNMHAGVVVGGWRLRSEDRATARIDAEHTTDLLNAVRGVSPVACRLLNHSVQNNWGGGNHGMVAGPESIGAAGDSIFDWAVSDAIEPSSLPQLRAALDDPDMCVRRTAASLIGRVRQSNGVAADVSAQLSSSNARTREAALLAIGYAGKKADRNVVEQSLRDTDSGVKLAAVWAIGMIADDASVPALTSLLRDGDARVRASAAFALGSIGSATAIPSLTNLLASDSDAGVRRAAAAALGRIDD